MSHINSERDYEAQFDQRRIRFANKLKNDWIDNKVEQYMLDPVGLLCEVDDCTVMVLAALKAVTLPQHQVAQAELNDTLYGYARRLTERDWSRHEH